MEVGHDFRRQHLVDVPLCIHAVSTPWANVLEDDWPRCRLRPIALQIMTLGSPHVLCSKTLLAAYLWLRRLHTEKSVGFAGAVSTFVRKEDVLPLSPVPVQALLCPLQSFLSMSCCQHWTSCWTPRTQVSLGQPPPCGVAINRCVVIADGVSGRFGSRE